MNPTEVAGQIIGAGTALAGLILVFLGSVFTSYDAYDAAQKASVRKRYQKRGIIALIGFSFSLGSTGFGFGANWGCASTLVGIGLSSLALGCVATIVVAVQSVADLFR